MTRDRKMAFKEMKDKLAEFLKALESNKDIGGVISLESFLMTGQVEKGLKTLFMAWLEKKDKEKEKEKKTEKFGTYCLDKQFYITNKKRHEIDIVWIKEKKAIFTAETKCTLLDDKSAGTAHYKAAIEQAKKSLRCSRYQDNKEIMGEAEHYIIHFLVPRNIANKSQYYPKLVEDRFPGIPGEKNSNEEPEKVRTETYHREHIESLLNRYAQAFKSEEPALIPNEFPVKDLAIILVQA